MKINKECMRELLSYIDQKQFVALNDDIASLSVKHDFVLKELCSDTIFDEKRNGKFQTPYTCEELFYALVQLIKVGYVEVSYKGTFKNKWDIKDINPSGHEFLETGVFKYN